MPKKLNAKQTVIKIGKSQPSMQAVLQVFSKPPKILPARGTKLKNNCKCIYEKKLFQGA